MFFIDLINYIDINDFLIFRKAIFWLSQSELTDDMYECIIWSHQPRVLGVGSVYKSWSPTFEMRPSFQWVFVALITLRDAHISDWALVMCSSLGKDWARHILKVNISFTYGALIQQSVCSSMMINCWYISPFLFLLWCQCINVNTWCLLMCLTF